MNTAIDVQTPTAIPPPRKVKITPPTMAASEQHGQDAARKEQIGGQEQEARSNQKKAQDQRTGIHTLFSPWSVVRGPSP